MLDREIAVEESPEGPTKHRRSGRSSGLSIQSDLATERVRNGKNNIAEE